MSCAGYLTQAKAFRGILGALMWGWKRVDLSSEDFKRKELVRSEAAKIICCQVEKTYLRRSKAEPDDGEGAITF